MWINRSDYTPIANTKEEIIKEMKRDHRKRFIEELKKQDLTKIEKTILMCMYINDFGIKE